jgi:protein tyrosine phosphatase (PTP) superfamily phosphohydrolase (DUF442 family)
MSIRDVSANNIGNNLNLQSANNEPAANAATQSSPPSEPSVNVNVPFTGNQQNLSAKFVRSRMSVGSTFMQKNLAQMLQSKVSNNSIGGIFSEIGSLEKSLAQGASTIAGAVEKEAGSVTMDVKKTLEGLVLNPHNHIASPGDTVSEIKNWIGNGIKWLPGDKTAAANGIDNFAQVDPGFYRGHVPSGQQGFDWLHSQGVGTEIDLREPSETPQTAQWAQNAGINHVSIAIPDCGTPTGDQINQLYSVLDSAKQQQAQDPTGANGVFIHCKAGANRTGTMVALDRIREGMSPDQAIAEAETRGMFPITIQPQTQKFTADEISFVLKYGDAYRSLGIQPGSQQEKDFNTFFTNFLDQHKDMSRSDFAPAITAAWNQQE